MKSLVRKVSAGIAILSFFLPWVTISTFIMSASLSGFTILTTSFNVGNSMAASFISELALLKVFAIFLLIIIAAAIWTVIQPKVLPTIILIIPSAILIIMFFGVEELAENRGAGIYLFTLSIIGVVVSLFLKDGVPAPRTNAVPLASTVEPQPDSTSTVQSDQPIVAQAKQSFCSECGNKLNANNQFCKECGSKVNG